jgi:hypothetical protein
MPLLSDVLQALPSIGTGSEFITRFGKPYSQGHLNGDTFDDVKRAIWKQQDVCHPSNLTDNLPSDTELFLYYFPDRREAMNPTTGTLQIVLDENDRIVGWTYSRTMQRDENNFRMRRNS